METTLLKALLKNQTFNEFGSYIKSDSFNDKNVKALYISLADAHKKFRKDLSLDELKAYHYSLNPTLSNTHKQNLDILFNSIRDSDVSDIVAEDLVKSKLKNDALTELASLALESTDREPDYSRLQALLDTVKGNNIVEETPNIIPVKEEELDELLASRDLEFKWKYPLHELQSTLGGIGEGVFALVAARPNTGKTAFIVSLIYHPQGFVTQGARVTLLGAEEKARRTKLRGMSCFTGITEKQLIDIPANLQTRTEAIRAFQPIKHKVDVQDAVGVNLTEIESYIKRNKDKIDILIIDQLDKVHTSGSFQGEHDRLRYLYINMRELAKKYNIAIIGVCQASDAAEGKLYFGADALENSKTGKFAEMDVIICIGKESFASNNGEDKGFRIANVVKNKLTGVEKPVPFMLNADISRIYS